MMQQASHNVGILLVMYLPINSNTCMIFNTCVSHIYFRKVIIEYGCIVTKSIIIQSVTIPTYMHLHLSLKNLQRNMAGV